MKIKTIHILIPVLIILLLIGGYYIFVSYQNRERETRILFTEQQKALQDAQQKITDLQKGVADTNQKALTTQNQNSATNSDISASEINPLLSGVVEITCGTTDGTIQGSGSLWEIGDDYVVLTNKHVLSSVPNSFYPAYADGSCSVSISDRQDKNLGYFSIYPVKARSWNSYTDAAILDLFPYNFARTFGYQLAAEQQNYAVSALEKCPQSMPMDVPVVVIGYPAFAQTSQPDAQGNMYHFAARTITNGIISAYDTSAQSQYGLGSLPYQNYFVSNRIDHGNSGGIAISKDNGKLCILGIPTWLNQGVSDTQGIVQNIGNVMYVSK